MRRITIAERMACGDRAGTSHGDAAADGERRRDPGARRCVDEPRLLTGNSAKAIYDPHARQLAQLNLGADGVGGSEGGNDRLTPHPRTAARRELNVRPAWSFRAKPARRRRENSPSRYAMPRQDPPRARPGRQGRRQGPPAPQVLRPRHEGQAVGTPLVLHGRLQQFRAPGPRVFIGYAPAENPKIAFCVFIEYGRQWWPGCRGLGRDIVEACVQRGYLAPDWE